MPVGLLSGEGGLNGGVAEGIGSGKEINTNPNQLFYTDVPSIILQNVVPVSTFVLSLDYAILSTSYFGQRVSTSARDEDCLYSSTPNNFTGKWISQSGNGNYTFCERTFYSFNTESGQYIVGNLSVELATIGAVIRYSDPHRGTGSAICYFSNSTTMQTFWYFSDGTFGGHDTVTYSGPCDPDSPPTAPPSSEKKSNTGLIIAATVIPIVICVSVIVFCLVYRRKDKSQKDGLLQNEYETTEFRKMES